MYVDLGGFGKYQTILTVCYILCNKAIAIILINLSFLEKVPSEYFCTYSDRPGETFSCMPKDFCEDPTVTSYKPNMAATDSYNNWVNKLDLACAGPSKIGLIASSYFIGWILTLTFLPRISDLFGRQKIIIGGNLI